MQKPTSEAIREQVSNKMAELIRDQISGLVVEAAFRTSLNKKKKTNLAQTITYHQSTRKPKETGHNCKSADPVTSRIKIPSDWFLVLYNFSDRRTNMLYIILCGSAKKLKSI